jgi:hypothetical protein
MTEREINLQRSIFAIQRRLIARGKLFRSEVRLSCLWATDQEFQSILDAIVASGIATRGQGGRGAEVFTNAMGVPRG